MRRFVHALVVIVPVSFWLFISFSESGSKSQAQKPESVFEENATSFEEIINAHGGRAAIAQITTQSNEADMLASTFPPDFIERRILISVDGAMFRYDTTDSQNQRSRAELFDGSRLHAVLKSQDENGKSGVSSLPIDGDRLRALQFSIDTFGLLPFLRVCLEATVTAEGRAGALDKFRVKTTDGDWIVYSDQTKLIRRLEMRDKVFQFAGYRQTGQLRLPFIERLSIGDRVVYELIFLKIDLNPDFPSDQFDPQTLLH